MANWLPHYFNGKDIQCKELQDHGNQVPLHGWRQCAMALFASLHEMGDACYGDSSVKILSTGSGDGELAA